MVKSDGVASTEDRTECPILVDFIPLVVFLVPCLLACLSCATPFPIKNLEEGMTAESVREEFGAPKAEEAISGSGATSCWTYWHEEQNWIATSLLPITWFVVIPLHGLYPGVTWDAWYLIRNSVFLHFEEEKLVHWEEIEPVMAYWSSPGPPGPGGSMGVPGGGPSNVGPNIDDPPTCAEKYGNSP